MTVRQSRIPVALAIEVLGAFALAAVLVRMGSEGDGAGPSLLAVAAVVFAAFALARTAGSLPETQARFVTVAASVTGLVAIVYAEYGVTRGAWNLAAVRWSAVGDHRSVVAGAVVLALVWLYGLVRWSGDDEIGDVIPPAAIAIAAVALAAMVDPEARGAGSFGIIAVAVFVLAWCLLALTQTANADEPLAQFAARWSGASAIVLGVAAALTIAIAAFDPHTLGVLSPALDAVGRALLLLIGIVLRPFAIAISFLVGLIPVHLPKATHDVAPQTQPPLPPKHGHTAEWLRITGYALGALAGVTILLGFLGAIWFAVRRRTRKPALADRRSAVERDGTLLDDLRALFGDLAPRRRRSATSSIPVRRLYAEMLARAAADGLERPLPATPSQFAPQLEQRYASSAPLEITRAFVASRYGLADVNPENVRRMRADWHQALRGQPRA